MNSLSNRICFAALLSLLLISGVSSPVSADERKDLTRAALAAYENGDYERALSLYQKAVEGLPEIPAIEFNRGTVQAKAGEVEEALKSFERGTLSQTEVVPPSAFYNQGNTYFEGGKFKEAIESYKSALRLDPDNFEAKYNLELALKQQSQSEDSEEGEDGEEQEQNQDQNSDQQGDQQQDKQEQNQEQDQQEQEQQDQQGQQEQNPQDDSTQSKPQQQQSQQAAPQRMSKEDAERLLNALKDQELKHQKNKQLLSPRLYLGKDW